MEQYKVEITKEALQDMEVAISLRDGYLSFGLV